MNERMLKSLMLYIQFFKQNGTPRENFLPPNDPAQYLMQNAAMFQWPLFQNFRVAEWRRMGMEEDPLPINQINIAEYIDEAVSRVYDKFEQYVEMECKSDEDAKKNLRNDVRSLWERLEYYAARENGHRAYGLAVGRVQSGKTRNYIGLMFKAIDKGFNTIIILTSSNNLLARQTLTRVSTRLGNDENFGLNVQRCRWLTSIEQGADGPRVCWNNALFVNGNVYVGVVLKDSSHLRQLRDWIKALQPEVRSQMRVLFIDDESDNATPNSNAVSKGIDAEGDVEIIVQAVRRSNVIGHEEIADWIEDICFGEEDWPEEVLEYVQVRLNATVNNDGEFMRLLEDEPGDADFVRFTKLNEMVEINGFQHQLKNLVHDFFNNNATRKQPFNRKVLRGILRYAFELGPIRSTVNRFIGNLAGHSEIEPNEYGYGKMFYVGYTATPYANMENERHCVNPLCPDFIMPLTVSSKYLGLPQIYGGALDANGNHIRYRPCRMNIVRAITADEYSAWVYPLQDSTIGLNEIEGFIHANDENTVVIERNHNFAVEEAPQDLRTVEWKSLEKAVKWAFCTAAARRVSRLDHLRAGGDLEEFSKNEHRWTTMLFHLHHEVDVHGIQKRLLERYLTECLSTEERRDVFLRSCMAMWREEVRLFTRDNFIDSCRTSGHIYNDPEQYPAEEAVEEALRWFVRERKYRVILMNSDDDAETNDYYSDEYENGNDHIWFICGGNMLSRGLTLDGLTVSYFDRIRDKTCVDTILQMARWFGYRLGYELLPRIWMTDDTVVEMQNICRIEDRLHYELDRLFSGPDRDTSIREGVNVAEILFLGRKLSGRNANERRIYVTPLYVFDSVADNGEHACDLTTAFCRRLDADGLAYGIPANCTLPWHAHHRRFWRNVPRAYIREFISSMQRDCFRGVQQYTDAVGLLRNIGMNDCDWNVVVGSPQRPGLFPVGLPGFEGYHRRNNTRNPDGTLRRDPDGTIRLGSKQFTKRALLARAPNHFVEQAHNNLHLDANQINIECVDEVYRLMREDNGQRFLTNPILVIDFVNGDNEQCFVQLTTYWYGLPPEIVVTGWTEPNDPVLDIDRHVAGGVEQEQVQDGARNEEGVSVYARRMLEAILPRLDQQTIDNLCDGEYCRRNFGKGCGILSRHEVRDRNGLRRSMAIPLVINGQQYYMTNDLKENNRNRLRAWFEAHQ